ncbi:hypothetical protein ACQPX6_00355 [Actinomycetospora sp. CA-101289]|uniref:hypothetical protein n=1 Tax=Actinomycetospora sp. CA-101289 TaxID=3239893 RepID=UPI003D954014
MTDDGVRCFCPVGDEEKTKASGDSSSSRATHRSSHRRRWSASAAFALLALDTGRADTGAYAWADPTAFYQALERVGVPRREIVETVH